MKAQIRIIGPIDDVVFTLLIIAKMNPGKTVYEFLEERRRRKRDNDVKRVIKN